MELVATAVRPLVVIIVSAGAARAKGRRAVDAPAQLNPPRLTE